MRVLIAGAHGKIGLLLGRRLVARGYPVAGIIRNPDHAGDLEAIGVEPVLLDLEQADVGDVAKALTGAEAAVFSAGAGPGSDAGRKDTVDRAASVLLADAAEQAGLNRFLQVSAMGAETVRDQTEVPQGQEVWYAYLVAKLAAEDDLRARTAFDWTILRPGGLTDDPATGSVQLGPSVPRGSIPRDDVAAVLVALLDAPSTSGQVLELISGPTPVAAAVAAVS